MRKTFKPGELAPESAIYDMVGRRGGRTGEQKVSTRDKLLPPTDKPGQGYVVAKPAHHKHRR